MDDQIPLESESMDDDYVEIEIPSKIFTGMINFIWKMMTGRMITWRLKFLWKTITWMDHFFWKTITCRMITRRLKFLFENHYMDGENPFENDDMEDDYMEIDIHLKKTWMIKSFWKTKAWMMITWRLKFIRTSLQG